MGNNPRLISDIALNIRVLDSIKTIQMNPEQVFSDTI